MSLERGRYTKSCCAGPIQVVLGAGALIEYLRTVKLLYKNEGHRRLLQPNKEAGLVV